MKDISTEMSGPDLVIEAYVDKGNIETPDKRIDELEEELKDKSDPSVQNEAENKEA